MAAIERPAAIDLSAPATWKVKLGTSITGRDRKPALRALQYNQHPSSSAAVSERRLLIDSTKKIVSAQVQTDRQKYTYSGKSGPVSDHYVLILDDRDKNAGRLEALSEEQVVNLRYTSKQPDEETLRARYAQLDLHLNEQDDSSEDDSHNPRADNPFDYRHLMADDTSIGSRSRDASATSTPVARAVRPSTDRSTPQGRPSANDASKKRKAAETASSASKRQKPAKASSPRPVPELKLARKATLRPGEEPANDDELILEDDSAPRHRGSNKSSSATADWPSQGQSSMALAMSGALSGNLGAGPISLHSAASSPASPFHSPAPERPLDLDDDDSIDLGGMSDGQEGGDEQEDNDVDDFELPSPVQDRTTTAPPAADDDDDDLSKELAAALAEDDDAPRHQSEEESEEE